MGLFDVLIRAIRGSSKSKEKNNTTVSVSKNSQKSTAASNANVQAEFTQAELANNIREILVAEYSKYELQENADIKILDKAQEFGGPVNFVLLSNGKPVGAIMIIDKGKKRTKRVHGVELACKNNGIGYANFYTHFNDREYFPFSREHAVRYLRNQIR